MGSLQCRVTPGYRMRTVSRLVLCLCACLSPVSPYNVPSNPLESFLSYLSVSFTGNSLQEEALPVSVGYQLKEKTLQEKSLQDKAQPTNWTTEGGCVIASFNLSLTIPVDPENTTKT